MAFVQTSGINPHLHSFSNHVRMCMSLNLDISESHSVMSDSTDMEFFHGILQARILEWVAFPFPRGSSQPRDWTQVSYIASRFFTSWATRETQTWVYKPTKIPALFPSHLIPISTISNLLIIVKDIWLFARKLF